MYINIVWASLDITRENRLNKKSQYFFEIFLFSSLSTIDFIDIDSYEYTQDLVTKKITLNEILKIITYITINKTLKDDEITNDIFKKTITIITSHFHRIFNVCLKKSYCSKHFRDSIIITLRKSKKSHYFTIVSYRSIALLNIMSKIMKFIVIKRINYLIETYNLLSITHMKVKKTMSIEHALHYIIEKVQTTWNENMMISIMLLNIIKVFNFMSHSRWLHNFKIKQIDKRLIRWIEYFLNEKITRLKINEHITNKINIKVEKL